MKQLIIYSIVLLSACSQVEDKPVKVQPYTGPLQVAEDLELYYSESATVKVKLVTDKLLEYANGDKEFPEGLYMEFYDEKGNMTSTLQANEAFYFKEEDRWRGRGDVEIKSMQENKQTLNTEELFWNPKEETIFTEKFVTITLPGQLIHGYGLTAKQDFSTYEITKPTGQFYFEDE